MRGRDNPHVGGEGARDRRARLHQLLERAAAIPHSGRSFLAHLIGTYCALVAWRQPPHLCVAGLLHSVYSTKSFPLALVRRSERKFVRELVGAETEQLIYAFCTVDRTELWRRFSSPSPELHEVVRLPAWKGDALRLRTQEIRAIVLLECANLAEQCCAPDGGPAPWMARVLGGWARLFSSSGRVLRASAASERRSIAAYRSALTQSSRAVAGAALDRAISYNPYAGELHVLRALCVDSPADAVRSARRGARLLSLWGVPWDKRFSLQAWKMLAKRAAEGSEDYASVAAALSGGMSPPWSKLRRRFEIRLPQL